ncbi:MAG TPA: hypothetical protein VD793_01505 [Gemmatimonadales bacterium]|nr:hypothetical protein [Gemmatimonadales bacterium]
MHDRDLERIARGLGERAARTVDPDRVAASVTRRLAQEPPARHPAPLRWWLAAPSVLRAAAVAALVVTGGLVARDALFGPDASPAWPAPLPELSQDELQEVLDSFAFDAPLPEDLAIGLSDLTETQLQELLKLMEG